MESATEMRTAIGEVHYFANFNRQTIAVISCYGEPHPELYRQSYKTYESHEFFPNTIIAINAKKIRSVVMMAQDPIYRELYQDGTEDNRWFCVEKPGLKIDEMTGYNEEDENEESAS